MIKILAFAGSARGASLNKKLAAAAAEKARELGAEVTLVDLADLPIPLYNGDLEAESMPENVDKLRTLMLEHDAFLIASPEYNGSITPLLKNTIDWTSRATADTRSSAAYRGKIAGLLSASPGGFGGMRGLVHVRAILTGIGVLIVPGDLSVGGAHKVLSEDGNLTDEKLEKRLISLVSSVIETASALQKKTT